MVGRGRKRTKFARHSGAWNLVDIEQQDRDRDANSLLEHLGPDARDETRDSRPDEAENSFAIDGYQTEGSSPSLDQLRAEPEHSIPISRPQDVSVDVQIDESPSVAPLEMEKPSIPTQMGPPVTPTKRAREHRLHIEPLEDTEAGNARTPRLVPLASPGLPLISPLIKRSGVEIGYFPVSEVQGSELDALAQSNDTVRDTRSLLEREKNNSSQASDDSLTEIEGNLPSQHDHLRGNSQDLLEVGVNIQEGSLNLVGERSFNDFTSTGTEARGGPQSAIPLPNLLGPLTGPDLPLGVPQALEYAQTAQTAQSGRSEDEDMYDAPVIPENRSVSLPETEQPRNVLDALEDFLQMSPVVSGASETFEATFRAPNQDYGEQPARDHHRFSDDLHEKIDSKAVEREADGQISPPFSFQQHWHGRNRPQSERRSSSGTTPSYNFDGAMEEQASKHVKQAEASSDGSGLDRNESSVEASRSPTQQSEPSAPHSAVDEEDDDQPDIDNLATRSRTTSFVSVDLAGWEQAETELPTSPILDSGAQIDHDLVFDTRSIRNLLTPAQTQESLDAMAQERTPSKLGDQSLSLLPTPRHTQEEARLEPGSVEPSQSQDYQEDHHADADADLQQASESQSARTYRVSQRPSRISATATNLSSPYFTSRRQTRSMASSSPIRENIPFLSSPQLAAESSPVARSSSILAELPPQSPPRLVVDEHGASPKLVSNKSLAHTKLDIPTPFGTGVATSIAYYSCLASLVEHFGQLVDVIAICTDDSTKPERAKSGPKDSYTTLYLTDLSLDIGLKPKTIAQIFRPHRNALPNASSGDAVILRNFKVQTKNHKSMLLSTDSSSWGVFDGTANADPALDPVMVNGPPLEYGNEELVHAETLVDWWQLHGKRAYGQSDRKTPDDNKMERKSTPAKAQAVTNSREGLRSNSRRQDNMTDNVNNEDDDASIIDGEIFDASASLVSPLRQKRGTTPSANGAGKADISDTPKPRTRSDESESLVHELRDGVTYVDETTDITITPKRHTRSRRSESTVKDLRDGMTDIGEKADARVTPRSRRRSGRSESVVHELRDGTKYVDDEGSARATPKQHTRNRASESLIHELRDGTTYVDGDAGKRGEAILVHELRDGVTYVDD